MSKRSRRSYMQTLLDTAILDPESINEGLAEIGLPTILSRPRLPASRRTEGRGGVYVVKSPDGLYKIGSSRNTPHRLVTLQTGSPVPLELVLTIPTKQNLHNALERTLHQRLASKRVRGEWFALSSDDVNALHRLSIQ